MKVALIILLLTTLSSLSTAQNVLTGTLKYCLESESYLDDTVRTGEYWQFTSDDETLVDTYAILNYVDIPIVNRTLVDYNRDAVFYQLGSQQFYLPLADMVANTPCMQSLHTDFKTAELANPKTRIRSETTVLNTDYRNYTEAYPADLLLSPAYIGQFPVLSNQDLLPFDGRGFSQTIPFSELPSDLKFFVGRFDDSSLDYLVQFYLTSLEGWQIALPELTDFSENPTIIPGDRQAYLTLSNRETDAILNLLFSLPRNEERLDIVVTLPQSSVETQARSVIEGSSQSLATKDSFFGNWSDSTVTPQITLDDGAIEVYALQKDGRFWFVDLAIENDEFEVLYSEVITQTDIDPEEFLPDWAQQP